MNETEKYGQYAKKVKIFHGLDPWEVSEILHQGQTLKYQGGQIIFHEGTLGSNIFLVLSGEIAIYRKDKPIAKCYVGDVFGEMAVLNRRPRCATAAALTDVKLFTLDEAQLNNLLEKRVAVRLLLNIIHVLSERLEMANAMISRYRESEGKRLPLSPVRPKDDAPSS